MNLLKDFFRRFHPATPDTVMRLWKESSLGSGWRYEDDWEIPEARDFVIAATDLEKLEASRQLGYQRSRQGVGIIEAIQDLRSFFSSTGMPPCSEVIESLAEGWISASEGARMTCTDAFTGLSTSAHLQRVLYEAYNRTDYDPNEYVICTIKLQTRGVTPRYSCLADLGVCCKEIFASTDSTLAFEHNGITVLMSRTPDNYLRVFSCHRALTKLLGSEWEPADIEFESLPAKTTGLLRLLAIPSD